LEVPDAGSVDLEVSYAIAGASWASSYDIRAFSSQPDIVVCSCYGEVRQVSHEHLLYTVTTNNTAYS
jgi:hypothetical protein